MFTDAQGTTTWCGWMSVANSLIWLSRLFVFVLYLKKNRCTVPPPQGTPSAVCRPEVLVYLLLLSLPITTLKYLLTLITSADNHGAKIEWIDNLCLLPAVSPLPRLIWNSLFTLSSPETSSRFYCLKPYPTPQWQHRRQWQQIINETYYRLSAAGEVQLVLPDWQVVHPS